MGKFGRRRIYLMRHGHVDYFARSLTEGLADPRMVPLTEEGREQAAAAGQALSEIDFDLAVYSGLPRTRETAEIVLSGRANAPELVAEPDLEELKSGWLKAKSREELAARLAFCFDAADAPDARFLPDGEKFSDAEMRIVAGITRTLTRADWKRALIVAHEGVNRILLGWACGGGLATIKSFEQDLACINVIDLDITPDQNEDRDGDGKSAEPSSLRIERSIIKAINVTAYDYPKAVLQRTSLEHLFEVDFGAARPRAPATDR